MACSASGAKPWKKQFAGPCRERLFQPGWKKLFEPESVKEQVEAIVRDGPVRSEP